MKHTWPSKEKIKQLQEEEYDRAYKDDDEPDPICDCGEPGYACCCRRLAEKIGTWPDGTIFDQNLD
jgi:hypothetical protein